MLAPYVPEDVALHYPKEQQDPDGQFASWRVWLCVIGYNNQLVKREDAAEELQGPPRSALVREDRQGASGIQRHHPHRTYQIARDVGWEYFEKLSKQRVMQCSPRPTRPRPRSRRAGRHGGRNEYNLFQLKEKGEPCRDRLPGEGTPLIVGPTGVLKAAPHPNRARLLQSYLFSPKRRS